MLILLTTPEVSLIILNVVLKLVLHNQKTQGGLNRNVLITKFIILNFLSILKKLMFWQILFSVANNLKKITFVAGTK